MKSITYRAGYRYQLAVYYTTAIEIRPPAAVSNRYIRLSPDGILAIRQDYAWDGPSGPTKLLAAIVGDDLALRTFMRGTLVHDALYQLLREGLLDAKHRITSDQILRRICREDGMSRPRAWWVYRGVRLGGGPSADPKNERPLITAPQG